MTNGPGPGGAGRPAGSALIELDRVAVSPAGSRAILTGVTFAVAPGEVIGLVGTSGAGKTTLLRTMAGLIPVVGGCVRFAGSPLEPATWARDRRERSRIAMITQRHDLVDVLQVHRNVMAGAFGRWSTPRALRYLIRPSADELAEAEATLGAVGLAGLARRRTDSLSGGQQQRVAIARALIQAPDLLLADEPVASLDTATAGDVLALLTGLARERDMAMVVSLHQPDLASRFCDRLLRIGDGQVIEQSDV